jgi:interleukin-1 receptor-associated kinase 1
VQAKQYLDVEDGEEDGDETLKMADPALGGRYDAEQLRNMAWAAKLCVHSSPHHRPQMSEVRTLHPLIALKSHACMVKLHSVFELISQPF